MALIQCGECGKTISDKAVACPHCGAPVSNKGERYCTECGQAITMTIKTCPNCGAPVNLTKQPRHRLTGIQYFVIFCLIVASVVFIYSFVTAFTSKTYIEEESYDEYWTYRPYGAWASINDNALHIFSNKNLGRGANRNQAVLDAIRTVEDSYYEEHIFAIVVSAFIIIINIFFLVLLRRRRKRIQS